MQRLLYTNPMGGIPRNKFQKQNKSKLAVSTWDSVYYC